MSCWTDARTVEGSGVIEWIAFIKLQIATVVALIFSRSPAATTFRMTGQTFAGIFIDKVIDWTLIFTLLSTLVAGTFLTYLLVESILGALLTAGVTLAAYEFSGQLLQGTLILLDVFAVVSVCRERDIIR